LPGRPPPNSPAHQHLRGGVSWKWKWNCSGIVVCWTIIE
jgi:hypothetical protein